MLTVHRTVASLRAARNDWRRAGESVALVPTMGALHAGHLALVAAARAACDRVVVSLFVNPAQFGEGEDFDAYPRDEAADAALLGAAGADALFAPGIADIYPTGFATTVTVAGLTDGLCGAHRPGHFAGVATVVAKLLNQCAPERAFFGEKDYQQLQVIRRLAADLDLPVEIVGVPTVREPDGLALSSRNAYLTAEQRTAAPALYRTLHALAERLAGGAAPEPALRDARAALDAAGFAPVDYLELRDADSLAPISQIARPARLLAAAWLGRTRLIDNLPVMPG